MTARDKEKSGGRFSADILPRIVCVLLALVIWLYVVFNNTPDFEKNFEAVSLTPENVSVLDASELTVYGEIRTTVEVVIYGSRGDITGYSEDDIKATVDFIGVSYAGKHVLPIKIEVPDGATLKSYYPKEVTVDVQRVTPKTVPVVIDDTQVSTSYTLGEPVANVKTVTVTGPESELALIHHVKASPVFDNKMLEATTVAEGVPLVACTESGGEITSAYIRIEPTTVKVEIPVYDIQDIDVSVNASSKRVGEHAKVSVSPSKLRIKQEITMPGDTLKKISNLVVAEFDENHFSKNGMSNEVELPITLNERYENLSQTDAVTVTIEHIPDKRSLEMNVKLSAESFVVEGGDAAIRAEAVVIKVCIPAEAQKYFSNQENIADDFTMVGNIAELANGKIPFRLKVSESNKYADDIHAMGEYFVAVDVK